MRTSNDQSVEFGVMASVSGSEVVLAARGEIDVLAIPDLTACLSAAIGAGVCSVIVDLADVDYIGSAGLTELSRAARSLETRGGLLSIRFPSATVRRILAIFGLDTATSSIAVRAHE